VRSGVDVLPGADAASAGVLTLKKRREPAAAADARPVIAAATANAVSRDDGWRLNGRLWLKWDDGYELMTAADGDVTAAADGDGASGLMMSDEWLSVWYDWL